VELATEFASVQRVFTHPVPRDVHVKCCHCIPACFQCCYITSKLNSPFYPAFDTLGTGYLNCLYAYKRKSASPVLNVLKMSLDDGKEERQLDATIAVY
jgi:hypothetical protein